jgi:hypothetical protein
MTRFLITVSVPHLCSSFSVILSSTNVLEEQFLFHLYMISIMVYDLEF